MRCNIFQFIIYYGNMILNGVELSDIQLLSHHHTKGPTASDLIETVVNEYSKK